MKKAAALSDAGSGFKYNDCQSAVVLPKVAVVITAYNAERYIGACLKAALAQTYPNFEVVIVDDGSNDSTERICRSIEDGRVRYLNRGRIGRQKALNEGVAVADAEFIAINDADDLSMPHRLRYTVEFLLTHPQAAFVGTGFSKTTEFVESIPEGVLQDSMTGSQAPVVWPTRSTVYRRNLFTHSTVVFPKRTWERIGGYDERLTLNEDYDFYLRAMQCGFAAILPGRTVFWYTNPGGIFKQRPNCEYLKILRFIKSRAHGLLGLPAWLRLYQPMWEMGFRLTSRYPALLDVVKGLRRFAASEYSPPS